jgi:hypothetical protein
VADSAVSWMQTAGLRRLKRPFNTCGSCAV